MTFFSDPIYKKINYKAPETWVATWFGCGFMKPAPGTWGTLGALPFGILLMLLGGPTALFIACIITFPIGLWASEKFDQMVQSQDSSMIVIDEAVGLWIALMAAPLTPLAILASFLLFRFFDALKPWPISWLDQNIKGAMGVMIDDVAAGIAAALCVFGLEYTHVL